MPSKAALEVMAIQADARRIAGIAEDMRASRCECDGELVYDEYPIGGYVKTSHYCPLHDDCEYCGERLGVAKDPSYRPGGADKRAYWICQQCLDQMCHTCGMDLAGCSCKKETDAEPDQEEWERGVAEGMREGKINSEESGK